MAMSSRVSKWTLTRLLYLAFIVAISMPFLLSGSYILEKASFKSLNVSTNNNNEQFEQDNKTWSLGKTIDNKEFPLTHQWITSKWRHTFRLANQTCLLQLGQCIGVGCDGAVWSSTGICDDGTIDKFAVKFYRNETDFIDKFREQTQEIKRRLFAVDPTGAYDTLAHEYSRILIPLTQLSESTGKCEVVKYTEGTLCPGKLSTYQWRNPDQFAIGSVMPFGGKPFFIASKEKDVQNSAISIIYGLAKALATLYKARIIHCDIQYAHATVINSPLNKEMSARLIDFGRVRICEESEDCRLGFRMQMFQFGSLILDFCRPPNVPLQDYSGAPYAFNGGVCGWLGPIDFNREAEVVQLFRKAWMDTISHRYAQGVQGCSGAAILKEIVAEAYNPLLTGVELNWEMILKKLKYASYS